MTEQKTVLNHIEHLGQPEQLTTVKRTTESRYQFRLLVQAIAKRLKVQPRNITFEKQKGFLERIKGTIEEHSIFHSVMGSSPMHLYALEGFPSSWVETICPPPKSYVVAETDEGVLVADNYHHRKKRDILKVLMMQLEMTGVTLGGLKKLDWSGMSRYEDYEPLLRKAKLMGWDEDRIGKELEGADYGNILVLTKRSDWAKIGSILEQRGPMYLYNATVAGVTELAYYRSLRMMGLEPDRVSKQMEIRERKLEELEEAAKVITTADLQQMAERVIELEPMVLRMGAVGVQLMLMNAPIRVAR